MTNNDNMDFDKKQTKPVPRPEDNKDANINDSLYDNILGSGTNGQLDISQLESFTNISRNRDQLYTVLDAMANDSTIGAVLETYVEDATERNENGQIVWVNSSDGNVQQFVEYLLETCCIDKNIYKWVYSLCKYGDVYIQLFRDSEVTALKDKDNKDLTEDVKLKVYKKSDHFVHFLENVPNPAEMFELTQLGKTCGYIKAPIISTSSFNTNQVGAYTQYQQPVYRFRQQDVTLYGPTKFVHAALEDNISRVPEQVDIFDNKTEAFDTDKPLSIYTVKRGQSLLYNAFKAWRELMLLENSVLLNRVTKSSIVRLINIEVGDMPKEMVGPHIEGIKTLIEQKSAINESISMSEYNNPGPIENNIYVPTHGGVGALTTQQIGGDVDVKSLADLDYYKNKLFGALRIPKQYFCLRGDTPILLLNGQTRTIKYLYDNRDTYIGSGIMGCSMNGKLTPTLIKNIMLTNPSTGFLRVTLDNGKFVDVTENHRMMLRDGTFIEANKLHPGDSLMPYYGTVRVVSIQYIDVKESAYDIEVLSDNHTFALSSGIFVHNCETDDSTGFNGGTSLSIISSRYAKMVKRIQTSMISALTDAINIFLIDKNLDSYVGKFQLHMTAPITQEEIDRRETVTNKVRVATDILNMIPEINNTAKLQISRYLLSDIVNNQDIMQVLDDAIENPETSENSSNEQIPVDNFSTEEPTEPEIPPEESSTGDLNADVTPAESTEPEITEESLQEDSTNSATEMLPKPEDLHLDFTDNTQF